jgi:hypothetical protein
MLNIDYRINSDDALLDFLKLQEQDYKKINSIDLSKYQLNLLEDHIFTRLCKSLSTCSNVVSINFSSAEIGDLTTEKISELFDCMFFCPVLKSIDFSYNKNLFEDDQKFQLFLAFICKSIHLIDIKGFQWNECSKNVNIFDAFQSNFSHLSNFRNTLDGLLSKPIPVQGIRDIIVGYVPPLTFSKKQPEVTEESNYGCCKVFRRAFRRFF